MVSISTSFNKQYLTSQQAQGESRTCGQRCPATPIRGDRTIRAHPSIVSEIIDASSTSTYIPISRDEHAKGQQEADEAYRKRLYYVLIHEVLSDMLIWDADLR